MIRRPRVIEALAGVLVFTFAMRANAEPTSSSSIAEQLFLEGKALMQKGEQRKACEKFKASHDLDPSATGTLLNLALCHEATNRPASAWAEFRQVAAESAGKREDRVALAREHAEKLFPILSRLTIDVLPAARVPGLKVTLDGGAPIAEAAWGTEVPIDPGTHIVEASAPGRTSRKAEVVIGASSDKKSVVIAPLALAPSPAKQADTGPRTDDEDEARRSRRVLGFALGGAGIGAVGVGIAFGIVAANANSDVASTCPDDRCVDANAERRARDSLDSANSWATVSNIVVGAGALLFIAGAVIVFTAPSPARSASRIIFEGARW